MHSVNSKSLALVWAPEEQRTESIARRLEIPIYHIHFLKYKTPVYAPFKYPLQWIATWKLLFKERPKIIYITNPPVVAVFCVFIFCLLTGSKYIMDTHPPALFMQKWAWSTPFQVWLARHALANVSDQVRFKRFFESRGASNTIVLERPPKDVAGKAFTRMPKEDQFEIAVVNTFAEDEPLQCVLDAARLMPEVHFYITGDTSKGDPAQIASAPPNCTFTGYLRGDAYWDLLHGCRAVMALTEWKNSLIMAGQDGISMHKPVIMSHQETTVEYFYRGTVFVENTGESIAEGIREVQRREAELIAETYKFLEERQAAWDENFQQLRALIAG